MYRTYIPVINRHRSLSDDMINKHIQYIPGMLEPVDIKMCEEKEPSSQIEIVISTSSLSPVDKEIQTEAMVMNTVDKKSRLKWVPYRAILGCLAIIGGIISCNELEYVVGGLLVSLEIRERWKVRK